MTRVKEPKIGTSEVPEYKSHPSRIMRSLRKGYDNQRGRLAKKSEDVMALRGVLRDAREGRAQWKERAMAAEQELTRLKEVNDGLEEKLKKRMH